MLAPCAPPSRCATARAGGKPGHEVAGVAAHAVQRPPASGAGLPGRLLRATTARCWPTWSNGRVAQQLTRRWQLLWPQVCQTLLFSVAWPGSRFHSGCNCAVRQSCNRFAPKPPCRRTRSTGRPAFRWRSRSARRAGVGGRQARRCSSGSRRAATRHHAGRSAGHRPGREAQHRRAQFLQQRPQIGGVDELKAVSRATAHGAVRQQRRHGLGGLGHRKIHGPALQIGGAPSGCRAWRPGIGGGIQAL